MNRLIRELAKLPSVGKRSAERMAFHLLKASAEDAQALATAISDVKQAVRFCDICFNLTERPTCPICDDPQRDRTRILVVEHAHDLAMIEATGSFEGVYHVLWGRLAPLEGVGPGDLTADALVARVNHAPENWPKVSEVILATHPNLEGDGTALYITQQLEKYKVTVTRLARGLPTGYTLDAAPKSVLTDAILGRQAMTSMNR